MNIEKIKLSNFWCFGEQPCEIILSGDLTVFLGANGAGKTAVMNGLLRMFGQSEQRRIRRRDFHVSTDKSDLESGQTLSIEAIFAFPELETEIPEELASVSNFYRHMTINEGKIPKCRFRLEATWTDDGTTEGDIQQAIYVITSLDENFEEQHKNKLGPADRARIRMLYVPAIRSGSAQITAILKNSLWKAIEWSAELKLAHSIAKSQLDAVLIEEHGLNSIVESLNERWGEVHKAGTDSAISFSPIDADFEMFSARMEPRFSPTESGGDRAIHELSDGQKSLLQISLTSAVLDLEANISLGNVTGFRDSSLIIPDLTIVGIEEPENNLAPFYLSRILRQLDAIAKRSNMQAIVSSHSASTLARIEPEHIRYFRKEANSGVKVCSITLPDLSSEAGKYVREAVKAHPEIYFAKFVLLGEGDSELIVLPKLAEAYNLAIDPSFVAMVPLGGRHVNHFWRLLNDLKIPHATLLDYDFGREGGGWGRIKYACEQLKKINSIDEESYKTSLSLPDDGGDSSNNTVQSWIKFLEKRKVYFSTPLDIDLLMLQAFPIEYRVLGAQARGPSGSAQSAKQAALKEKGQLDVYDDSFDDDFLWYRYLFLGRGKPVSHLNAISTATSKSLAKGIPKVLKRIFNVVKVYVEIDDF